MIVGAIGSGARAEPLNTTMEWALRSSFDRKADDARQEALDAEVTGRMEAFLPTVGYQINHRLDSKIRYSPDYTSVPDAPVGIDTVPRRQAEVEGFQLTLPLFDGMKRHNELEAARSAAAAGRRQQDEKTQQILLDTASAYLSVLRDRTIVRLREAAVADVSKVARNVAVRLAVHDATNAELALAESRVLAAQTTLEQARAALMTSETELVRLAGPKANPSALPPIPNGLLPASVEALREALLGDNPKIAAARLKADSAAYNARVSYARFSPQLNLVFSHTRQGPVSNFAFKVRDTSTFLQAQIPIYQPGEFSDVARGHALADQKGFEALDLERTVIAQATTAFDQRRSTILQVTQAGQRVAKITRAVQARQMELRLGSMTVVDVLNTVAELAEARVAKINLEFARDRATYALAAAMNRLRV